MDPNTRALARGAAGAGEKVYVEDVFNTWLYTGNGSTQTITNGIDLSGKGGLVWLKRRDGAVSNLLMDTARTPTPSAGVVAVLRTDTTGAQSTSAANWTWNANGFTNSFAGSSELYASWTFRKAAKFFDVVTYTGDGTFPRTLNHNLGAVPGFVIIKCTSAVSDWIVWHRSLTGGVPGQTTLYLNRTDAAVSTNYMFYSGQGTVSNTQFGGLGAYTNTNESGQSYVAYLFAHDAGGFGDSGNDSVVKCGSFTADGSGNATVDLGWEPQWLLLKSSSNALTGWIVLDNMRGLLGGSFLSADVYANSSIAEASTNWAKISPTGFSVTNFTASSTGIYIAIRRGPMKTPTDATKVFSAITVSTNDSTGGTTNFPVDWLWELPRGGGYNRYAFTRLLGAGKYLQPNSTDLENTGGTLSLASNTSFTGPNLGITSNIVYDAFSRAPGFFDVVTCSGSQATRSHNLGVRPELIIGKHRNKVYDWFGAVNLGGYVTNLSANSANLLYQDTSASWNTYVTTTSFDEVYIQRRYNGGSSSGSTDAQIYYLFASCPGVSKVGSYTGTGTALNIDCGFTNGARFVMIKRTDSAGDWYVWDTARGIIAANDPYLLLNSTAADVTNTDYIDPLSSGFQISSTAPAAINTNGGSFIFLAVA